MSTQHNQTSDVQTKYSLSSRDRWSLAADVPISDHALERYRERTPNDADVPPRTAWRRGEDIKHPAVLELDSHLPAPERVRVYRHGHDWMAIFVVGETQNGETMVVTVYNGHTHEHGPTRAYLHSHGPHYEPETGREINQTQEDHR